MEKGEELGGSCVLLRLVAIEGGQVTCYPALSNICTLPCHAAPRMKRNDRITQINHDDLEAVPSFSSK